MTQKLIQILKIVLPVSLGIYLAVHIYGQLDDYQRKSLFSALLQANYSWVIVSLFIGLLSHYIRGYRWKYQLEAMGYTPSVANNFMAVMVGYLVNLALPRVGEVSRAAYLSRYTGIPFQKSFGSILSERAIDLIMLAIICGITILLQYNALKNFSDALIGKYAEMLSSPVFWIVAALLVVSAAIAFVLIKKYQEKSFLGKIWVLIEGLIEGLKSIFRMKNSSKYLLATVAIWVMYIAMFWVCFFAIPETAIQSISSVFAAFVVGSFAIAIIPGGIGAFPVGIMQSLALYGIAQETGFALGWIIWLSQTVVVLLVGGVCMFLMPIWNKRLRSNEQVG